MPMVRLPFLAAVCVSLLGVAVVAGCGREPGPPPAAEEGRGERASTPPLERGIDPGTVGTGPRIAERILVLALDGATWSVLDPLLEAGRMPHLRRLMDEGVSASLETLEPTVSPAIWTTIATGFPASPSST